MVQRLRSLDSWIGFIEGIKDDPAYSDPMFSNESNRNANLYEIVDREDHRVFGVTRNGDPVGLFSFSLPEDERYMEMLVGLSREDGAYEEMAAYLLENYPGYQADFVFNPRNDKIRAMLKKHGASFDTEQQKMVLTDDSVSVDCTGVENLTEAYVDQYCAIHEKDCYWTAERIVEAKDIFRVFLAIDKGKVVGYLDITDDDDENEPFDIMVVEAYRRRGWGRKLLGKAIEENRPRKMILFVEVDNIPALKLYGSMGFTKAEGQNSVTATWNIPGIAE